MKLANYVSDLLYRYDCVIVPEFGGFICNKTSAEFDENAQLVYPPRKKITFNAYLQHNDGLLANYIASAKKTTFKQANQSIAKEVETWKELLEIGTISIAKVGTLRLNADKKLIFEPNTSINFLTESFGLAHVNSFAVERLNTIDKPRKTADKVNESNKLSSIAKAAVAATVFLGLTYAGWYGFQKQNLTPQTQKESSKKNIQSATFVIDPPMPTIDKKTIKKETKTYHIVVGAFQKAENARKKVINLKNKGFDAKIIKKTPSGLMPVICASFADKKLAIKELQTIKLTISKDAWLLKN
ncbi:MAG: SPOR domain-containing protein [Tenacibaculum sp.]